MSATHCGIPGLPTMISIMLSPGRYITREKTSPESFVLSLVCCDISAVEVSERPNSSCPLCLRFYLIVKRFSFLNSIATQYPFGFRWYKCSLCRNLLDVQPIDLYM